MSLVKFVLLFGYTVWNSNLVLTLVMVGARRSQYPLKQKIPPTLIRKHSWGQQFLDHFTIGNKVLMNIKYPDFVLQIYILTTVLFYWEYNKNETFAAVSKRDINQPNWRFYPWLLSNKPYWMEFYYLNTKVHNSICASKKLTKLGHSIASGHKPVMLSQKRFP